MAKRDDAVPFNLEEELKRLDQNTVTPHLFKKVAVPGICVD
jgi:hypothetical protein